MIQDRYVLFNRIPVYAREDGTLLADALWAKDLMRHLDYIPDFHLCCPLEPASVAPEGAVELRGLTRARVYALRRDTGWGSIFANLWPNFASVSRATAPGGIMHSGGAGWAFPLSYYLLLLRLWRRFRWVILIESTFWMLPEDKTHSLPARVAEAAHRRLIRACLRRADARIFTQDWYREVLFGGHAATLVAPASWIDEELIQAAPAARAEGPARVLFPTRMTAEKGVETVLDALKAYEGPPLMLDIVGQGALSDAVDAAIAGYSGPIHVGRLPMRPYGAPFFALLRDYDAILIANRTEEQPRLIFDAFSQAIPCIASATNGNTSLLTDGETGWTFPPGDVAALVAGLRQAAEAPETLEPMRAACLAVARRHTHGQMHRTRENFLHSVFGTSP